MKLTVNYYDLKLIIEEENDILCDEMLTICLGIMTTMGFHPDSIKKSIIEMAESYENSSNK